MTSGFIRPEVRKLAGFLAEAGLSISPGTLEEKTFLPGILIRDGGLVVDESRLLYPGDILHEAGHLAVIPSARRRGLNDELLESDASNAFIEVAAIAWSYAACVHLGEDPALVFHSAGYKGRSQALLFGFSLGVFPGANHLESAGLTALSANAAARRVPPFPHMLKWACD